MAQMGLLRLQTGERATGIQMAEQTCCGLLVALLLAEQEFFLCVQKPLSRLRLTGHHQLRGEVAGTVVLRAFPDRLSFDARWHLLLVFNDRDAWGLRGALPSLFHTKGYEVLRAGRRRLFRMIKGLVL